MRIPAILILSLSFVVAATAVTAQQGGEKLKPARDYPPAFEMFKKLSGDWVGKAVGGHMDGKEVKANYRVTSNGSAVVETLGPGTPMEMVTVIHPDGDGLILTHYCALGNQPQMKAAGKPADKKVAFAFVRATNLKSDQDMYMHDVTFTFIDNDTLRAEWVNYDKGKAGEKAAFEMKRKK